MSEKSFQVSVGALINFGLWGLGISLISATCWGFLDHPWAIAGLASIIFGCMREVIYRIERQHKPIREAFELGRESMRLVNLSR